MDEAFVELVKEIAPIFRKRNLRQIGVSPLVNHLPSLVKKYIHKPVSECSSVFLGEVLIKIFIKAIDALKPEVEIDTSSPPYRNYFFLKEYFENGIERTLVEQKLAVARSLSYEIQQEALDRLAVTLWEMEVEEGKKMPNKIVNNLSKPKYDKYIERVNPDGKNYINDIIVPELRNSRSWIIAINGRAGVGKSSIAFATAEKIIENMDNYNLAFDSVIWISFRKDDPQPTKDDDTEKLYFPSDVSMAEVFNTIGVTLGYRNILQLPDDKKEEKVNELLDNRICLFVFDNLDSDWLIDKEFVGELEHFVKNLSLPHKVIATLREEQFWGNQSVIKIEKMNIKEAHDFIKEIAKKVDQKPFSDDDMNYVYEKTFGVPLAMKWALGLNRVYRYSLDEALNFGDHGQKMLRYMYEMAYKRLSVVAKKILHMIPHFRDFAFPEALEYVCDATGPEVTEQLGRLFRAHLIESTTIEETQEHGYTLLPFVRQFVGELENDPESKIDGLVINEFIRQAKNRMPDYYIERINACAGHKESVLIFLKYEKSNILKAMDWCWTRKDDRFVKILELIGIYLGTLHYLNEREKWGRRAFEFLNDQKRFDRANWHQIYDVAWTLTRKGNLDDRQEGIKILQESLQDARKNNWNLNIAIALTNLGKLAISEEDYVEAEKCFDESKMLFEENKEDSWINVYLRGFADLLLYKKEYQKAIQIYVELRKKYQISGDINGQIESLSSMALAMAKNENLSKAEKIGYESVNLAEQIAFPAYSSAFALSNLAEIMSLLGNKSEATQYANEAILIFNALGMSFKENQLKKKYDIKNC